MACYKLSSMLELMQDPRWSLLAWMTLDILVWSRTVTYDVMVVSREKYILLENTKISITRQIMYSYELNFGVTI